jgi:hypothetical protein
MSFVPIIGIVWTRSVKNIGIIGHVYIAGINTYKNPLQMNPFHRVARICTIRFLRRWAKN